MAPQRPLSPSEAYALRRRVADLELQAEAQETEIARLNGALAALQSENLALQAAIGVLRASLSWRISAPVRVLGSLARNFVARQPTLRRVFLQLRERRRPAAPGIAPAALPVPTDPNARYIYQPGPFSDHDTSVVTLDMLYHLSRSL